MNWYNIFKKSSFIPHRSHVSGKHIIIEIDPKKFDNDWRKTDFYLSPFALKQEGDRGFGDFLQSGKPIEVPYADYDEETGQVGFIDGQHRFAYWRDNGWGKVPIMIKKEKLNHFKKYMN